MGPGDVLNPFAPPVRTRLKAPGPATNPTPPSPSGRGDRPRAYRPPGTRAVGIPRLDSRDAPGIPPADWWWALERAQIRRWGPGEMLFRGPASPRGIYWLGRGAVRLTASDAAGEPRLLAVVTAPCLAGDPGPLFGRPAAPLVATCITACHTAFWPYTLFATMLEERPSMALLLAHQGMEAYHQAAWRVIGLLWPCPRLRILHVLVTLARAFPLPGSRGSRLPASLTQQAIGLAANTSRVSVNRVLSDLRRQGIVGRARPLYIRDAGRLEALLMEEVLAAGEAAGRDPAGS